jgi:hypothetical protein
MKRFLLAAIVCTATCAFAAPAAFAGNGNGAPSGPHYNLNLIGFAQGQTYPTSGSGGNVIHVPLYGKCNIDLTEGPFSVLNDNCTGGSNALFSLPNPDPMNTGTSVYSVYAAARGKPMGSATADTCFTDTTSGLQYCSVSIMTLTRKFGQNTYMNATQYLLYAYACVNGTIQRLPLFSQNTSNWYWAYDNSGLRNASLRFYPGVQTPVPAGGATCTSG